MLWSDQWNDKTIGMVLDGAATRWGDKEMLVFPDARLSFTQLKEEAHRAAKAFLRLGIKHGDRVSVWMANYKEWTYVYYALAKIGAIIVPINARYTPSELEYALKKTGATALILKDEQVGAKNYIERLREICPETEGVALSYPVSPRLPALHHIIAITERQLPGVLSYSTFIKAGEEISEAELTEAAGLVRPTDTCLIQFTSGTTGLPKGVILFHLGVIRGCYYAGVSWSISEDDRFFNPQPFFHGGGSIIVMLLPVVCGCTVVTQPYFEPGEALRMMEEERCTVTMGHQPHWVDYVNHPEVSLRQLKLQRALIFAPAELLTKVAKVMKIPYVMGSYGLTEIHLAGTACSVEDLLEKRIYTLGRPKPGVQIEIRDQESGTILGPNEIGEICVHSWGITPGYYDDEEETRKAIDSNGWFHTGDLGQLDNEGYLSLVGRIKDVIRVGGVNVAASEIEHCLLNHPQVNQAVVVGVADERRGEVSVAWVETKGTMPIMEEELIAYCRRYLASYKVPRRIYFRKDWPMTGTSKIQRLLLKKEAEHIF